LQFTPGELADPAVSGDNADPDKDTFGNRQEYVAGTNPKDSSSYLRVADVEAAEDNLVIRFEAVGDKSYTIQGREEAAEGAWKRVLDLSPQGAKGTTKSVEVLDTLNSPERKKFYRIVTPQEVPQ